jgi:integrase/recombinase XerD
MKAERTPAEQKAKELAGLFQDEDPDYAYLKAVFRALRIELGIQIPEANRPNQMGLMATEVQRYYDTVWQSRNLQERLLIKILLYTGIRVRDLISIQLCDVDTQRCQIRLSSETDQDGKVINLPEDFQAELAQHLEATKAKQAVYLFESSWKRPYSDRGIRKILTRYAQAAQLPRTPSLSQLRQFLQS